MSFRGGKFSKSRGAAVDVPYFLSRYDPDPLRYYLLAMALEREANGYLDRKAPWFQIKEDKQASATTV